MSRAGIVTRLCLALALAGGQAAAQNIITRFAGGAWIYPRTSVRAADAPLGSLSGLAFAPNGDLLVADELNAIVVRINSAGVSSVVAGNGIAGYSGDGAPAVSASLNRPKGVVADPRGNIYIADSDPRGVDTGIVRRVLPDGTITTFSAWSRASPSSVPQSMAVDGAGNVYIANTKQVWRFDPSGAATRISPPVCGPPPENSAAASAIFNFVSGVAVDPAGNVYIADMNRLYRVTPAGLIATAAANVAPGQMFGDRGGNLYFTEAGGRWIRRLSPSGGATAVAGNGKWGYSGDGGPAVSAGFERAMAVTLDAVGTVYVADGARVRSFPPGGNIRLVAGNGQYRAAGDGGPARDATFLQPGALAMDGAGNLYIADATRIRRVAPSGIVSTVAGNGIRGFSGDGGPAAGASIGWPTAMVVDGSGTLYFSGWNQGEAFDCPDCAARIRRVTANGIITTVRAGATAGPAEGLALDRSGNLYVSDANNSKVLRITPGGAVSVYAGAGQAPTNFGYNGDNIPATQALLNRPAGLAMDAAGNLYIADSNNGRVRRVSASGVITTIASNLGQVRSVLVDSSGTIFAADRGSVYRIAGTTVSRFAGGGSGGSPSGDGGPALSASVAPEGLAVDPRGNMYLSEVQSQSVRMIHAAAPNWSVSPARLEFQAQSGGPPVSQTISVTGLTGLAYNVFALPEFGNWLSVSATGGFVPSTIQVSVNPAVLASNRYTGRIVIAAPPPLESREVTVSLTVSPAGPPQLAVLQSALSFTLPQGNESAERSLPVTNRGGGVVYATVSAAVDGGGNWLRVSPNSIAAASNAAVSVAVSVSASGLPPGTYSGRVVFTTLEPPGLHVVPVTLTIGPSGPSLLLSQTALTFTAVAEGGAPPPQTFSVLNRGSTVAAWTAAARTLSGTPTWLAFSPSSGVSGAQLGAAPQVQVSVNTAGLSPGLYQGQITVTANPALSQAVLVVLNVLPVGSSPPPVIRPTGLIFTSPAGTLPPSQQIRISNLRREPVRYSSGRVPESPNSWFAQVPGEAVVPGGGSAIVSVHPTAAFAQRGVTRGALTFLFDDGSLETVNLLLVTTPGDTGNFGFEQGPRHADGCVPGRFLGVFTSFGAGGVAIAGQPFALSARIADDCGVPLDTGPVSAVFSSGDAPLPLSNVGNGEWEATWTPAVAGQTAVSLNVAAAVGSDAVAQANLQVNAVAGPALPVIFRGGVASAAHPQPGVPLGLGGFIANYGDNFANRTELAASAPLPTTLAGAQVTLGGRPLPLLYVSPGQINAVVPYDAPLNVPLQLWVSQGGLSSSGEPVVVAPAQPAIFLQPHIHATQGAIFGPAGLASPETPVRPGDTIAIYCAGLGPVTPPIEAGGVSSLTELHGTVNPVTVSIGGRAAVVQFAGLAPGSVGQYQVNVIVPDGVGPGDRVPVVLSAAGQSSPAATIAVR
jgi:uncharacterized protein (TIGR03437 family)